MECRHHVLPAVPSFAPVGRAVLAMVFLVLVMSSGPNSVLNAQHLSDLPQTPWTSWLQQSQSRLLETSPDRFPRCLTTHVSEHIRSQKTPVAEFETLFLSPHVFDSENSYQSPGGGYLIWYDLEGEHAVPPQDESGSGIPDWVEMVAAAADSSRAFYRDSLGFKDPIVELSTYNIYIRNLGFYGFTGLEGGGQTGTPFSVIDSTFDWIPGNDAENEAVGAAQATVAHEIYHSIQFAYNQWQGPTGDTSWLEMDALMAENQVFPDVKEYLNFIGEASIFRTPAQGTPVAYEHATWLMYFTESVASDFMRHVWERIEMQPEAGMENIIRDELGVRGLDYDQEIVNLHLWHIASGAWSREGFGFADAHRYPTSFKRSQRITLPTEPYSLSSITANAANYYAIVPQSPFVGNMLSAFFAAAPETGWGIIAYNNDGSVQTALPDNPEGRHPALYASEWEWSEIEQLGVVVVNSSELTSNIHQLLVSNQENIEQIRYGDVNEDGLIREQDAVSVLENAAGVPHQNGELLFARHYAADVSGNGQITAFDAGLIYRASSGFGMTFPADISESGFGPDLPRFNINGEGAAYPSAVFGSGGHHPATAEIVVELQAESLFRGEEALVDVVVSGMPEQALSVELTLFFPASILEFQEVLSSFSNFGEIIQAHAVEESGKVKVVWASNQYAGNGLLGTLVFQMLDDGSPEVVPTMALINEIEAEYELIPVTFDTEPGEPVSTEPDPAIQIPDKTTLGAAYPNPFNPVTIIPLELSEPSDVSLRVYDSAGRLVVTLSSGIRLPAGQHAFQWDATGFASGVYFLLMEAKGAGESGSVVRNSRSITLLR